MTSRPRIAPIVGILLLSTIWWVWTAGSDVTWFDSGELTAAGYQLGVSHPPGQPAHAMLVKIATLLPVGSIAFRANLVSVMGALAAIFFLWMLAVQLWGQDAAFLAATSLFFTWDMAEQAQRAEVYTLSLALVLAAILAARQIRPPTETPGSNKPTSISGGLVSAGLICGLAAAIHPLPAAWTWLGLTVAVAIKTKGVRGPAYLALGTGLGSLIWLYLPAAGNRPILLPWTNLSHVRGVLDSITGLAYSSNLEPGTTGLGRRLWLQVVLLEQISSPATLLVAAAGFLFFGLRKQWRAVVIGGGLVAMAVASSLITTKIYPANPDLHGYLLPAVAGICLLAAGSILVLRDRWLRGLASLVVFSVIVLGQFSALAQQNRDRCPAGDLPAIMESAVQPGPGLVSAESDHVLFVLLYAAAVGGWRPDLAIANSWMVGARAPWYRRYLKKRWPWLYVPLVDDRGPNRGIRRRFIIRNAGRVPVYVERISQTYRLPLHDCGSLLAVGAATCKQRLPWPRLQGSPSGRLLDCFLSCHRSRLLTRLGQPKAALAELAPFVARPVSPVAPGTTEFLCRAARPLALAARILTSIGALKQAAAILHRARALDPTFSDTYVLLGRLAALAGALRRAERLFRKAISYDRNNVEALFYLALTLAKTGREPEADAIMSRAARIDRNALHRLVRTHRTRSPSGFDHGQKRNQPKRYREKP